MNGQADSLFTSGRLPIVKRKPSNQEAVQKTLWTKTRFFDSQSSDSEPETGQHLALSQGVQARRVGQTKSGAKRRDINGREDGQKRVACQFPASKDFHPA